MKNKSILLGLLALMLAGLFTVSRTPAQGNSQRFPHSVIMLGDTDLYHYGPSNRYIKDGLKIDWVEADQYAPEILVGDRLADTIAKCMDLGYTHEVIAGRFHLLKR